MPFASPERAECVELRREVLRRPLGLDFTPEFLAGESADTLLAAYLKDQLVACLLMSRVDASTMKIRQVAVAPNLQGQGIGTRLVFYAETWLRQAGGTRIVLHSREVAVPFYLALGYRTEGEPFTEVGIPHLKMSKSLVK